MYRKKRSGSDIAMREMAIVTVPQNSRVTFAIPSMPNKFVRFLYYTSHTQISPFIRSMQEAITRYVFYVCFSNECRCHFLEAQRFE